MTDYKAIEKAYNLLAMHHSELLNMNAELQERLDERNLLIRNAELQRCLDERRIWPQIWYKIKRIFTRRYYD